MARRQLRWFAMLLLGGGLSVLSGCALVSVSKSTPRDYQASRRGEVLTTGTLSHATRNALAELGIDPAACNAAPVSCSDGLRDSPLLSNDQRLSALAELSLGHALQLEKASPQALPDGLIGNYLQAARYAWAYLFMGDRTPAQRAFTDRQTQVRDDYNYALERVATLLFRRAALRGRTAAVLCRGRRPPSTAGSCATSRIDFQLPRGATRLEEIRPASRLRVGGLRNVYRRDGLGAELVMVARPATASGGTPPPSLGDTGYLPATVLARFPGDTLAAVLAGHAVDVEVIDPYRSDSVQIDQQRVPLAANFSAPYALWLADASFGQQAIKSLLGRSVSLEKPRVFLMQPYDPQREVVVMIHGLASSPRPGSTWPTR